MSIVCQISEAMQKGRAKLVKELISAALEEGVSPKAILEDGLLAGMNIVGAKFKKNEVFVPEVLIAARAMNAGTAMLKPYLTASGAEPLGKACLGTVKGDLHDIGKNLVRMMLEGKGIEVIDLGVDVPPDQFVQAAIDNDCSIIACSALLTTTMPAMRETVAALNAEDFRPNIKIMVGGAPITQEFADEIGADAYTADAASAAQKAKELAA